MILEDTEAVILNCSNGNDEFFHFVVNNPHLLRLWVSDDLDPKIVKCLQKGTNIRFCAEEDDEGDMVITKLEILNGQKT